MKKKVLLRDIKENLFVRSALNQDHALYLADLIENGVQLPPMEVTRDLVLVDGRHRKQAYEFKGVVEVTVEIINLEDEGEIIARAYRANVGGSLPPTKADTEHTIRRLLDKGVSQRRIVELLDLPTGLARKYVKGVQSKMSRANLQRAVEAVTEGGLNTPKAAEQYGVDLESLKDALSGRRRRRKEGIPELKADLSKRYKSIGLKNVNALKRLIEKFEDGDVTAKQVDIIFNHIEHLQKRSARVIAEWRGRFDSLQKTAVPQPQRAAS